MPFNQRFIDECTDELRRLPAFQEYAETVDLFNAAAAGDVLRHWTALHDDAQRGLSIAYRARAAIRRLVNELADAYDAIAELPDPRDVDELQQRQRDIENVIESLCRSFVPKLPRPGPRPSF
jgi:phytoene dehydrogenase-like protein